MSLVERLTWLKSRTQLRLNDLERAELDSIIDELREQELDDVADAPTRRLLDAHEEPALADKPAFCPPVADSPRSARATHPWRTFPRKAAR